MEIKKFLMLHNKLFRLVYSSLKPLKAILKYIFEVGLRMIELENKTFEELFISSSLACKTNILSIVGSANDVDIL